MKTAGEIYTEYKIMPSLQLHQLRVAAVAKMVADNFTLPLDKNSIVLAALLHDMGNIIKFDLTQFPEFRQGGIEQWEAQQVEFKSKYGINAHTANVAIANEIGLSPNVVALIDGVSFSNLENIVMNGSWEQKIVEYADDRVGPHGILPLRERLEEARKRYISRGKFYYTDEGFQKLSRMAEELEKQIFSQTKIEPDVITDSATAPLIEELRKYSVA